MLAQPAKCETVSLLTPVEPRESRGGSVGDAQPQAAVYTSRAAELNAYRCFASATPSAAASAIRGIDRRVDSVRSRPTTMATYTAHLQATLETGSASRFDGSTYGGEFCGISHRESIWEIPLNSRSSAASDRGGEHRRLPTDRVGSFDGIVRRANEDAQPGPKDDLMRVRACPLEYRIRWS